MNKNIRCPLVEHIFIIFEIFLIYFVEQFSLECAQLWGLPNHRCSILIIFQYFLRNTILGACCDFILMVEGLINKYWIKHPYFWVMIYSIDKLKNLSSNECVIWINIKYYRFKWTKITNSFISISQGVSSLFVLDNYWSGIIRLFWPGPEDERTVVLLISISILIQRTIRLLHVILKLFRRVIIRIIIQID